MIKNKIYKLMFQNGLFSINNNQNQSSGQFSLFSNNNTNQNQLFSNPNNNQRNGIFSNNLNRAPSIFGDSSNNNNSYFNSNFSFNNNNNNNAIFNAQNANFGNGQNPNKVFVLPTLDTIPTTIYNQYKETLITDLNSKDKLNFKYISITADGALCNFSFEEIRYKDMNLLKNGHITSTMSNTNNNISNISFGVPSLNNQGYIFSNNNQIGNENNSNNVGSIFKNINDNNQNCLFGNNVKSIFGTNNITQFRNNNKTLFGINPNSTNLLGNNNNNNTNSTSLFGNNNNNNTNSTSLFGNNNNTNSTSLFLNNNNNNNNTNSTSLFLNNNNTNSTSLFGNNNNNDLFGNNIPTTSLFGNNNNSNSTGLFRNMNSNNLFNSNSFEMNKPNINSNLFNNNLFNNQNNINEINPYYINPHPIGKLFYEENPFLVNKDINNYIYGRERKNKPLFSESINDYLNKKDNQRDDEYESYKEFKDFLNYKRMQKKYRNTIDKEYYESPKKDIPLIEKKIRQSFEPIRSEKLLLRNKAHSFDMSKKYESRIISNLETSFNKNLDLEDFPKRKKETNSLNIHIQINEPYRVTFSINATKNSKTKEFKEKICETLTQKNSKYKNIIPNSFILMKKYSIVKENELIENCGLENGDTLYIILKESIIKNENISTKNQIIFEAPKTIKKNELASLDKIPILTKAGYKTNPSMTLIYRMTLDELENVENFSIENENGKIEFESKVNLSSLNLDAIVEIRPGVVSLYDKKNTLFIPSPGFGLNKKATIHLYNISELHSENEGDVLSLKFQEERIKEIGGKFIDYNSDNEEFIYEVEHF